MRKTSQMAASSFALSAQRTVATSTRPNNLQSSCARIRPRNPTSNLQQSFRRSYAETLSPTTKRRGRGIFRWTWRLTYFSAIGGIGWLGYSIYTLRTPHEQFNPDPSKKTLVVLGMHGRLALALHPLTIFRYWLGLRVSPKETGHRKLQCHCHLSAKLLPVHPTSAIMYYGDDRTSIYNGANSEYLAPQESHGQVL